MGADTASTVPRNCDPRPATGGVVLWGEGAARVEGGVAHWFQQRTSVFLEDGARSLACLCYLTVY